MKATLRPSRAVATALCLALGACGGEHTDEPPPFALAQVVAPRIAELETALAAETPTPPEPPDPVELRERVRGLVAEMAGAQGRWRETLREDAAQIGAPALPLLAASLADPQAPPAQRAGAVELLGAIDAPAAAERLLSLVEGAPEPWMRRAAAFQLASTTQDQVVPRLVLRLKYEVDGESVVWIAHTLAHFGSYAGLEGLYELAQNGATPELRALAAERLAALATEAGLTTPDDLWRAWNSADARELPGPEPSLRHRLAIWKLVDELSGEHFQLRGVDDARFELSRGAAWVVEVLAEALHERDAWKRVHAAQCLERMGLRGLTAGPVLRAALADPFSAPAAADALGSIADPEALGPLVQALAPERDLELRAAAARALGRLGLDPALVPLRALLAPSEPIDLRGIAAVALVRLGAGDEVAGLLLEILVDERADPAAAEEALGVWLASRAERGAPGASERLERWRALQPPPPTSAALIPSPEEVAARRGARAAIASEELDLSR